MPIVVVPAPPIEIPKFPLSEDQVFSANFSELDSEESQPPQETPKKGESRKSKEMREKRKAQREQRKEARKAARDKAKEEIKKIIKQKLDEISKSLEAITAGTAEVVLEAPGLLAVKVWMVAYDATYIKPLEAQLAIMAAQAALSATPGSAPALAAADQAALILEISLYKDQLEQIKIWYDDEVAKLKTRIGEVNSAVAVIVGACVLLQLTTIPPIGVFTATLAAAIATMNALVSVL